MFKCKETCYADRLYERGKTYDTVDKRVRQCFDCPQLEEPIKEPEVEDVFSHEREKTLTPEERREQRQGLIDQLELLGVEYNPKWGLRKLRECLDKHGA